MIFLRSIVLKQKIEECSFPFTLPVFKDFEMIEFKSPVTFFVGENGSGKSTLIEAIAYGMNAIAVGSEDLNTDISLQHIRVFSSYLRFVKNRRPKRGFFFRAEDFFGFIKRIKTEVTEFKALESEFEDRFTGYGKLLATGMAKNQHSALRSRYGEDADAFSHGEAFLNIFKSRLVPEGLYILDEPETPLSPQKQLSLLSLIKKMVEKSCQFIIASHSPILMAYPDAQILSFDGQRIKSVAYDDVEHVALTKSFLNNPDNYIRQL
jgi:predicted ATPase